jgi:threonine dehydrogenase-like Zn-dependent dehydrogenase
VQAIQARQSAIQLIGPGEMRLNQDKPVPRFGDTQILCQVECAGLCFSDTKLLREFGLHPRKTPVLAHLPGEVLRDIPGYVPGSSPTVPGHEVVLRVIGIGRTVTSVALDGRYVVQADFRDLKTNDANGAFGYNFEGGLQQYVLLDERVTIAASGESYLLPVPQDLSASQLALIEPWACIENAFSTHQRRGLRPGGTMLVVGAGRRRVDVRLYNPETARPRGPVDYCMLMAPVPALVEQAIEDAAERGIINIFAGISAQIPCPIDLNSYARKQLFFVGTSGSNMTDMRAVLGKIIAGQLDTSLPVGAVSGMAGAIDGLTAVRNRTIAGKIIVYPALGDLPLIELDELAARYPSIRALLANGCWTKAAEQELLHIAHAPISAPPAMTREAGMIRPDSPVTQLCQPD